MVADVESWIQALLTDKLGCARQEDMLTHTHIDVDALSANTEFSKPFWDSCNRCELLVVSCQQCGRRFFTPEGICPSCRGTDLDWVSSSGVGQVYSYTVVHRPTHPELSPPYVIAAVDLTDGSTMMTNIVGCDVTDVTFGMTVEVQFSEETKDGKRVPYFRPTESIAPNALR
jgi:uncharacterized OB-fold protein